MNDLVILLKGIGETEVYLRNLEGDHDVKKMVYVGTMLEELAILQAVTPPFPYELFTSKPASYVIREYEHVQVVGPVRFDELVGEEIAWSHMETRLVNEFSGRSAYMDRSEERENQNGG